MADFNALQALINAYIKQNGVKAITGQVLNGVLTGMVSALGKGYTVAGEASPATDPGTMTGPVSYIAHTAGTYTHFGNLVVEQGEVAMLIFDEAEWHKEVLLSLSADATIDGNVGTPEVGVSFVDGVLTFDFRNMKGNPGVDGLDGAAAGFGSVTATVDANIGTPAVEVQTSGPDTGKNFAFAFRNLKGETGVTSVVVTVDNTTGTPSCAVSLVGQVLHLNFTGLKGAQGDTGSSVDYPFTIVNNLTTDDATQALSAAMGVQLESEVSQLEAKVDTLEDGYIAQSYTLINGAINPNGSVGTGTTYKHTSAIPVVKGQVVKVSTAGYNFALIAKDENGTYTPIVNITTGDANTPAEYTWKATETMDISVTVKASLQYEIYIQTDYLTDVNEAKVDIENLVDINAKTLTKNIFDDSDADVQDGGIDATNGTVRTGSTYTSTYYVTGFIPVYPGKPYIASLSRWYSWYKSDKTYISGDDSLTSAQVAPSNAAFLRVTFYKTHRTENRVNQDTTLQPYDTYLQVLQRAIPAIDSTKILNGAITTEKVADRAINASKTDFIKLLNMFDKSADGVELGKYLYNNTLYNSTTYNVTDYIPVVGGTTYLVASMSASAGVRFVCYYNSSKTYLSSVDNDGGRTLTVPSGASFMRCSLYSSYWDSYRITDDTDATKYYPYGYYIKPELLFDSGSAVPQMTVPSKIYALNGEENSIYHRNYLNFIDKRFFVDGNWPYYSRFFRSNSPLNTMSFQLKNISDLSIVESLSADVCVGYKTTDNGAKVINAIGDSFTYNGTWYNFANTLCPNLSWVGMRKSSGAGATLRAEGRGGWKLEDYMTRVGSATTSFSPFIHPSGYSFYGCIEFWAAVVNGDTSYNIGGFSDFASWFGADGKKLNPSENDMMYDATNEKYIYWNGSSWVDYSGTPTFVFDYGKYISVWGITSPDIVIIMLGVNDWFSGYNDAKAQTWNANMQTVIQSIQDYATANNKTIKIGICTNTVHIGTESNSYHEPDEQVGRQLWLGRKNTIETFDTAGYRNDDVYVVDTGVCLDPDFGFSEIGVKPFDFYTGDETENYTDNGVHPSTAGYKQLGVCAAAFIQYVR